MIQHLLFYEFNSPRVIHTTTGAPACKGKPSGRKSLSHWFVKRGSVPLCTLSVFNMGLEFLCAPSFIYVTVRMYSG